jgi:hypothetical protein
MCSPTPPLERRARPRTESRLQAVFSSARPRVSAWPPSSLAQRIAAATNGEDLEGSLVPALRAGTCLASTRRGAGALSHKCVIPTEASRRDGERRNLAPGDPGRAFADRLALEARFLDFGRREAAFARNDPLFGGGCPEPVWAARPPRAQSQRPPNALAKQVPARGRIIFDAPRRPPHAAPPGAPNCVGGMSPSRDAPFAGATPLALLLPSDHASRITPPRVGGMSPSRDAPFAGATATARLLFSDHASRVTRHAHFPLDIGTATR